MRADGVERGRNERKREKKKESERKKRAKQPFQGQFTFGQPHYRTHCVQCGRSQISISVHLYSFAVEDG